MSACSVPIMKIANQAYQDPKKENLLRVSTSVKTKKGVLKCLVLKGVSARHEAALTDGKPRRGYRKRCNFFATCRHSFQLVSSQHLEGRQKLFIQPIIKETRIKTKLTSLEGWQVCVISSLNQNCKTSQPSHLTEAKALRPRARLNLPAAFSSYFTTRSSG